jgi:leucyl-tRNA synthetase
LEKWPEYDSKYLVEENIAVVVQVNGKLRDTVIVKNSKIKSQNDVEEEARKGERVQKYLSGKRVKKVIYVEGKIINFVVI